MSACTSQPSVSYTPIPNRILDEVVPLLRDSEVQVLLVIVRQTLGWIGEQANERKERDWLTHSQLKGRTRRSSQSISQAIASLVRRSLIEVYDDAGDKLDTPQKRRACHGRLYFALSPRLLNVGQAETEAEGKASLPEAEKPSINGCPPLLESRNY